jgi:hypothetical protein
MTVTTIDHEERSRQTRRRRKDLRSQISSGELSVADVIGDPPDDMRNARLSYVLRAIPMVAEGRMRQICGAAGVRFDTRLRDLKVRERLALIEALKHVPPMRHAA